MIQVASPTFAHRALWGFSLFFVALGIAPFDRKTWLAENLLVMLLIACLWCKRSRPELSYRGWWALILFLIIHQAGAHYTYPQVPYNQWLRNGIGFDLDGVMGWQRNQFDRFTHLSYGLLLILPMWEVTKKLGVTRGYVSFIAWNLIMSTSAIYELMEWIGGAYLGNNKSGFVGSQNDFWDAQKDMALAGFGAGLTLMFIRYFKWDEST